MIKARISGKPLLLCGHSQGGALALAFATQMHRFSGVNEVEVVTFGQPKIGSVGYCRYLDMHGLWPVNRFVNMHDGVTSLPPSQIGYAHCETPSYLWQDGTVTTSERFKFSVFGAWRNHPMEEYVARIESV